MTVDAADKSAVVLRLRPQSGIGQEVKKSHLSIEPQVNLYEFHDAFGKPSPENHAWARQVNNYKHLHG
jgi:hypothetical protein